MERAEKTKNTRGSRSLMEIFRILHDSFGPQGWWPVSNDGKGAPVYRRGFFGHLTEQQQFEISVGAILTQNTSWNNVLTALGNLRSNNFLSRKALLGAPLSVVKRCIRPAGYFNQKAKKLQIFCRYQGPITRDGLLSVWGIGPETADSILLYAHQQPTFVIDAYTKRVMERIGFNERGYEELRALFHENLSPDYKLFNEFHALFVELGKKYCTTRNPVCSACPLKKNCAYGREYLKTLINIPRTKKDTFIYK